MKPTGFFATYTDACGLTMIPERFHRWASISLVAATLEDRVWVEHHKNQLFPNLYLMLVGPSGCGKGAAIDFALARWHDCYQGPGRLLRGALTKQRLLDVLGGRQTVKSHGQAIVQQAAANPHPWIVSPELYNALGAGGPIAESFIANLTDLYTNSPVPITEGTRQWGDVTISGHCINWLAGTTSQWLRRSLSQDAILSGFFGRVVAVEASYASAWMEDLYPTNYTDLCRQLQDALASFAILSGACTVTADAADVREQWLRNRDVPADEYLRPAYQRDDDLLLKLAMILSVGDSDKLVIERTHMARARALVAEARACLPSLITLAHTSPKSDGMGAVIAILRRSGYVTHSHLLKIMSNRGVTAEVLRKYISTLEQAEHIVVHRTGRGLAYEWKPDSKPL